jgi:hypothetical protein
MEQASKQAGVSMIMVEGVVHPEQQQLLCGVHNTLYHDLAHTCLFTKVVLLSRYGAYQHLGPQVFLMCS